MRFITCLWFSQKSGRKVSQPFDFNKPALAKIFPCLCADCKIQMLARNLDMSDIGYGSDADHSNSNIVEKKRVSNY